MLWYSKEKDNLNDLNAVSVERLLEIQSLNKKGIKVEVFNEVEKKIKTDDNLDFTNVVGQESLTRFDKKKNNNNNNRNKNNQNRRNQGNRNKPQGNNAKKSV